MENYLTQITNYLLTQSWQIAVLTMAIAAASLALKNKSAHVRYLLWLIVLAKCLVPPLFTIPLAVLPQEKTVAPVQISPVRMPVAFDVVDMPAVEIPVSPTVAVPAPTVTKKLVRLTSRQWLGFGWVVGAAAFAVFAVVKALRTNFWLWRQRRRLPAELQTGIENLFSGLEFRTLPNVWLLEGIGQPFVWGLLRGSIYLPADFIKVNSDEQRKGILGHELSHILRFDAAVNILQIIAQAVFWFHPFVWWANKKIRAEREKCCDEMVVARLDAKAKDYSSAIVNILISEHESTRPVPSLAVAGPVKNIEERLKTMMRPGKKFYKRPSLVAAITVFLLALLAVLTTFALTSRAKPEPVLVATQHNKEDVLKLTDKLVHLASVEPGALTVDRLADICGAMESAIVDISMEYEWYVEPPLTLEDIAGTGILINKGRPKYQWSTARPFDVKMRSVESVTFMSANGDTWQGTTKRSCNGKITKFLSISRTMNGELRTTPDGTITKGRRFIPTLTLTPMGFSVLRFSVSKSAEKLSLAALLRRKETVHLDNTIQKVDGFNTICADFSTAWNKQVLFARVYFSVDHGYTPIRYEYMNGPKLAFVVSVTSLEKVTKGLWFPSSGITSSPGDKEKNVYRATSKIAVNQGLTDKHFDIEFPPGTKVRDEIRDTEYIVEPKKEQKEKFEKNQKYLKENANEMAVMKKEGGRIYSMARLRKLGTTKDLYMMDNDRKFPQTLDDLKLWFSDKDKETFSWLVKNVEWLGAGLDLQKADISKTPIAYDKTLLKKGKGTNVLFVNGIVEFCRPKKLEKLGITSE